MVDGKCVNSSESARDHPGKNGISFPCSIIASCEMGGRIICHMSPLQE